MRRTPRSPTLWHIPDHLWKQIWPILEPGDSPRPKGRPRVDARLVLDGILFRLRTGCQWNHIPPVYGSDTTLHRYFLKWTRSGAFERVWALLLAECPDLGNIRWKKPVVGPSDADDIRPEGPSPSEEPPSGTQDVPSNGR